jgi:hypothetical protein
MFLHIQDMGCDSYMCLHVVNYVNVYVISVKHLIFSYVKLCTLLLALCNRHIRRA